MCGIAGVLFSESGRRADPAVLKAMGDAIAHRGPDAEGFFSEPGVGLVHRRLSIIDLSGGGQPLGTEDGSVQVVFNGEIYNFQSLQAELEGLGHRFRTRSDTEVLVHLYEELGEEMVGRLRGMFAFAIWDARRRRLLLARDRLGIKPLYVYRDSDKLLFGSEIKAILAYPGVSREVDPCALEDYLAFGMVTGPRSIFRAVEKLPAAHTLTVRADDLGAGPRRYWRLRLEPDDTLGPDDWAEEVRAKVDESVRLHLIADVPVGAFLSGGIDSSIVVARAAAASRSPLLTFSIGFNEESHSELPFARLVSRQFGTRHTEEIVTPDAVDLIDELIHYYDEPFADPSAVPTYLVSRLAARDVKVVLSGDGGDEAFAGYSRYSHDLRETRIRGCLPGWFRHGPLGVLASVWPKADWLPRPLRAKTLLTNLSLDDAGAHANTLSLCRPPTRRKLMASGLFGELNGYRPERVVCESYATAPPRDPLAGMLLADTETFLTDDFLVKVDRASMAHGLEVRPPLLDHELLELAGRIPSKWKVRNGRTKWILKRAFEDTLPATVVRRRKQGFEMPIDQWLRGPLGPMFRSAVLDPRARIADLVDQRYASDLYRDHLAGRSRIGGVLWGLLILARWSERFLP